MSYWNGYKEANGDACCNGQGSLLIVLGSEESWVLESSIRAHKRELSTSQYRIQLEATKAAVVTHLARCSSMSVNMEE